MPSSKIAVVNYVNNKYQVGPDYPWSQYPSYAALRHHGTDKWFALLMNVPRNKLGLEGTDSVDVVNVKCRPEIVGSLRLKHGYLPAYHMNKEHWLTVLLDNTVPEKEIFELIDDSYLLTKHD
ncbi:MmcQ/YjbR family DNA-binding protein [Microvirgula aerodenitrificans]|uniref:MmcQ/YjbR family DNA-binding protein n=1 Tax=Microvirgula aerodenitrificans TaxID=57480 RepID=UPI000A07498A|nr:MmcQ/YjbR family DNA-binding protein [Microvirgula aerodenitrificans]